MTKADLSRYAEDGVKKDKRSVQYHFPIITTLYPTWYYITAVVVDKSWGGVRPTDEELRIVGSFHDEYVHHYYGDPAYGWIARQREKHPAFDIDGGANGRYLLKRGDDNWAIKCATWETGAFPRSDQESMGLVELMDWHHTIAREPMERWVQWKSGHSDVFGVEAVRS